MDFVKDILLLLLGFIGSLFIASYNYRKNKTTEKLEIAYNRFYYPIYLEINKNQKEKVDYKKFIETTVPRVNKYRKYIDVTLLKLLIQLEENINNKNLSQIIYAKFCDNIYNKNIKLRKILGYINPNIFQIYISVDWKTKYTLRLSVYILIIYLFFGLSFIVYSYESVLIWFTFILLFSIMILVIDTVIYLLHRLYKYLSNIKELGKTV